MSITIRVSPETHEGLKGWAEEDDRSLSRQVIRILEEALRARQGERRRRQGGQEAQDGR